MTIKRAQNIVEHIFNKLSNQIISGKLKSGERLPSERELSGLYNTNRNTLREAIRKLEQSRLVTVRPGQGVTVTDFRNIATLDILGPYLEHTKNHNHEDFLQIIVDLLHTRAHVLDMAVGFACVRATETDLETLQELSKQQSDALANNNIYQLIQGDLDFVSALVRAAHSLTVQWIANTFIEVFKGLITQFPIMMVIDHHTIAYHISLIDALSHKNSSAASALTQKYYQRTDPLILHNLKRAHPALKHITPALGLPDYPASPETSTS